MRVRADGRPRRHRPRRGAARPRRHLLRRARRANSHRILPRREWKASRRSARTATPDLLPSSSQRAEREWDDARARARCCATSRRSLRTRRHGLRRLPEVALRMLRAESTSAISSTLRCRSNGSRASSTTICLVTTDDGGTGTGAAASTAEKQPLTLVLDHLRSAFNVGAIFRTADCLGISRRVRAAGTRRRPTTRRCSGRRWARTRTSRGSGRRTRRRRSTSSARRACPSSRSRRSRARRWSTSTSGRRSAVLLRGNERHDLLDAALLEEVRPPSCACRARRQEFDERRRGARHVRVTRFYASGARRARAAAAEGDGAPEKRARRDVDSG